MIEARSYAEAHVYMDLQPCRCGAYGFGRDYVGMLDAPEAGIAIRFEGVCGACGRTRGFTFHLPAQAEQPTAGFSYPGDGPSRLIDAAQWYAISVARSDFLRRVREEVNPAEAWSDPQAWDDMVQGLSDAAEAVREAMLFVADAGSGEPGDAPGPLSGAVARSVPDAVPGAVPGDAIWTDGGRATVAALGGHLTVDVLQRQHAACRAELDGFVRRYPQPEDLP